MKLQRGFTLIELMMVVSITLILTGASVTAFLNFNKTQSVNNDARNLAAEVYRVRTLAASLQYPTGCSSLKSYALTSNSDLSGVIVTAKCDPADVAFPEVRLLTSSVFSQPLNLVFLPGSGYLEGGTNIEITIKLINDTAVTKKVTVGAYGTVTNI